jgi:hypothetical protein
VLSSLQTIMPTAGWLVVLGSARVAHSLWEIRGRHAWRR